MLTRSVPPAKNKNPPRKRHVALMKNTCILLCMDVNAILQRPKGLRFDGIIAIESYEKIWVQDVHIFTFTGISH